jgi:hypothetical protein
MVLLPATNFGPINYRFPIGNGCKTHKMAAPNRIPAFRHLHICTFITFLSLFCYNINEFGLVLLNFNI